MSQYQPHKTVTRDTFDFDTSKKYKLITRGDMDGLISAVLLKSLGVVGEIKFAHPKDMQDGTIEADENCISTNLPYVDGIYACFDHHSSEIKRISEPKGNHVIDIGSPSAARVVYNFFGGAQNEKLKNISEDMMLIVDKADSAQFTKDEVLKAEGWTLISFLLDARTGLGRFGNFTVNQYEFMLNFIDYCVEGLSINDILEKPDVKERIALYREQEEKCMEQLDRCGTIYNNLVVLDLRNEDTIWAGNRFLIYAMYPRCNISMHIMWGLNKQNTVFAVGKSIFDRSSKTHIGNLMLEYDGGGHTAAGTCQIANIDSESTKDSLIEKINADG